MEDKARRKHFGWAISNWGTGESRLGRTQYPRLREYMFAALIARTDVDFIALDKGEITSRKVVDELITKWRSMLTTASIYAGEDGARPELFFKETAFLRVFTSFLAKPEDEVEDDDEPESLD